MRLSSQLLLTFLLERVLADFAHRHLRFSSVRGCCETPWRVTGTGFGPPHSVLRFSFLHLLLRRHFSITIREQTRQSRSKRKACRHCQANPW